MHDGGTVISTFEERAGGRSEARLHYRTDRGWSPPLPPDVQPPDGLGRATSGPSISRSASSGRPAWVLGNNEPWRLW